VSIRELLDILREQLEAEREANRENRRIIARLTQRIPAIEAGDERESSTTASEEAGKGTARSRSPHSAARGGVGSSLGREPPRNM
jgi:hypothetical protein